MSEHRPILVSIRVQNGSLQMLLPGALCLLWVRNEVEENELQFSQAQDVWPLCPWTMSSPSD